MCCDVLRIKQIQQHDRAQSLRTAWGTSWRYGLILAGLLGLAGCSAVPSLSETSARLKPAFAAPDAQAARVQLAPCMLRSFAGCTDFRSLPGLRQVRSGRFGELDFRAQAVNMTTGQPVSLWHDLPLIVSDTTDELIVNAFFEVSRGTQAKLELNKWAPHNPIWQDRKPVTGQEFKRPRYYAWSPAPGNYGALPRTWENVLEPDPLTGFPGDTDPIDVVDIGTAPVPLGLVTPVKVIGALGMIDGTDLQTDWKIYVVRVDDPLAKRVHDITDIPSRTRDEWALFWRFYKAPTGHAENFFYAPETPTGFSANPVWLTAEQARAVVRSSAEAYRQLVDQCLNLKVAEPYWIPNCVNSTPP